MNDELQKWAVCPVCGSRAIKFDGPDCDRPAECHGVRMKCTRGCKEVFELVIREGRQVAEKE